MIQFRVLVEWNGIKILSSDWVITSTKNGVYTPEEWPDEFVNSGLTNYKYQWWLASEAYNAYTTIGKDGQYLYIDPDKNLIIIRLGDGVGDVSWIWLFQEIAKGIQ